MKKKKMVVIGNEVKLWWEFDFDLLENEGFFGEYFEMGMLFVLFWFMIYDCI